MKPSRLRGFMIQNEVFTPRCRCKKSIGRRRVVGGEQKISGYNLNYNRSNESL